MGRVSYVIEKIDIGRSPEKPFAIGNIPYYATPREDFIGDAHEHPQLCVVLTGKFEVLYPERAGFRQALAPGQFYLANSWEPHCARATEAGSSILPITFRLSSLGDLGVYEGFSWVAPLLAPVDRRPYGEAPRTRQAILALSQELRVMREAGERFGSLTRQWLKIHEIFLVLLESWSGREDNHRVMGKITPALRLIMRDADESPGADECAAACHMGRSAFSFAFHAAMGMTFRDYQTKYKMSKAATLLRQSALPIKTIAVKCGFSDVGAFYHAFTRYYRETPMAFKKNIQRVTR